MTSKFNNFLLSIIATFVCVNMALSQQSIDKSEKSNRNKFTFLEFRGTNVIDLAAGSAIVNGDYRGAAFEAYFRVGYKRHISSHLNVNVTYNKYNLAVKDTYNEGFMSFDLNLEYLIAPFSKLSPFLYAGGGYNASNYFVSTATKVQGGVGFEIIILEGMGLKLFGEYNYIFSDELDGLVAGEGDDTVVRAGVGLTFYFGGNKKKETLRKKMNTVINSNLIIPYN